MKQARSELPRVVGTSSRQFARTRTIPEIVPWKYSPDSVMSADICRVSLRIVDGSGVEPICDPSFESITANEYPSSGEVLGLPSRVTV